MPGLSLSEGLLETCWIGALSDFLAGNYRNSRQGVCRAAMEFDSPTSKESEPLPRWENPGLR